MSLVIRKKGTKNFTHEAPGFDVYSSSDMVFVFEGDYIKVRSNNGRIIFSREGFLYSAVTIYDDSTGGGVETFASIVLLQQRLIDLKHPAYSEDGEIPIPYVSKIIAGPNISIDPPSGTNEVTITSSGGPGGGASLTKDKNQVGHGLSVGNFVRVDGSNLVPSQADNITNAVAVGVVISVTDVDNFTYQVGGWTDVNLGLTDGDSAWLSLTTAGGIQTTKPSNVDEIVVYLGQQTAEGFLIEISEGYVIQPGTPPGGGNVDSVNGQTGDVVLDADDIDDSSTTNKYTTQADIDRLASTSGANTGDETTGSIQSKRPIKTVNGESLEGSGDITIGISLEKNVNQTAHGFSEGNVVRLDGSDYFLAQADVAGNAGAISFVTEVIDADNFKVQSESYISTNLGLNNGDEAFLSTTVAGGIQTTKPAEGELNVYLGQQTPQGFLISISTGFVVGNSNNGALARPQGFIDYNDTTGVINLVADTWTTIPNNGQGAFSNDTYKPDGVVELMDVSTGAIDVTDISLGDAILIRNDFQINPSTNNALLEFRYQLGAGGGAYTLETNLGRLDDGSGKNYRFSLKPDLIYMGDLNTRDNPIILQVKLSTDGILTNAGTVIQLIKGTL